MCGCLTGTLPQFPQQNVFLGLPLELMAEEAALLVEIGAAYVVDDVRAHQEGLAGLLEQDKNQYLKERQEACLAEALAHQKSAQGRKAKYVGDVQQQQRQRQRQRKEAAASQTEKQEGEEEESIFAPTASTATGSTGQAAKPEPIARTATTTTTTTPPFQSLTFYPTSTVSAPAYHRPTPSLLVPRPNPSSYALYKRLHTAGYFLSPGLRFGCQFMAYPGDPLRFHSHFITRGLGWDEEIDLIDIVGGGRLGTGVKKAWMFGGKPDGEDTAETRVFCVEWGGF